MEATKVPETLQKWLNHKFSSGAYTGDDFKEFDRAYGRWLKKAMPDMTVKMNPNHYEFSAVVSKKVDGEDRFVYISISDVRFFPRQWAGHVLVRTMRNATDWTGGPNTYCCVYEIPERVEQLMRVRYEHA